jgi:hypothetical protein
LPKTIKNIVSLKKQREAEKVSFVLMDLISGIEMKQQK